MAFTKAAPARTQTQQLGSVTDGVKCDGHKLPARKFQAGPQSKNPGRWFYSCPLPRDDPKRCKFFKWADELAPSASASASGGQTLGASPARLGGAGVAGGTRLGTGRSPAALTSAVNAATPSTPSRLMRPTSSALHTPSKAPHTPVALSSVSRTPTHGHDVEVVSDGSEEIDWESLDTEAIERDAEARATPRSSQSQASGGGGGAGVKARLEAASPLAMKRKLSDAQEEEGEGAGERTPKRAASANPFLTTPTSHTSYSYPLTPDGHAGVAHPVLGGVLGALGDVGEHLARQDRLVRAAESMKRSMRMTIKNLQERVKTLEGELEAERGKNK